jgi:hypothetical protein
MAASMQAMGKVTGGTIHRLKIDGFVFNVGSDWSVRVARILASGEQFKGVIMEVNIIFRKSQKFSLTYICL